MQLPRSIWDSRSVLLGLCLVISIVASPGFAAESPRRIFLISGLNQSQPTLEAMEAFKQRLQERSTEEVEVILESLDLALFPGKAHEDRMVRFLGEKYAQVRPDLIVSTSRGALEFVARRRAEFAAGVPIIYCCSPESVTEALDLPPDIPGIVSEYSWAQTLALAERLQPNAKTLALVSGGSDLDQRWRADALNGLKPALERFELRELAGLSHDELLIELSRLPRDTIVILTRVFADGQQRWRNLQDVAADITRASAAPVYSPLATLFAQGVVGGAMGSFSAQGTAVADLALDVLAGKDPTTLPHETRLPATNRIDARQLERWGLSETELPRGSVVEFRQPTIWDQYGTVILAAVLAFIAQTGIIAFILLQMRKRREAERSLKESEDRMAFAAASTNIGLWRMELATGRLWATDHCRSMFGIALDAPLTWDAFLTAIHPEDRQAFGEWLQFAGASGLPRSEVRVAVPRQELRWYVCRGRMVFDDQGQPLQISGIFADVTSRKVAEAEAENQQEEIAHLMRVAALGELSGGIAHELSQPLAAILANAQAAQSMLSGTTHDKEVIAQILEDIVDEDRRAGQVIHRLRRLLKKGEHQSGLLNLNDLTQSTLALLHSELVNRKIKVNLDLKPELPLISGDSVQLQQVLLNLMMNAMEAMTSTAAIVRRLSIATRVTAEGYVEVAVSDRGRGIAPEEQRRLFQPFFTTKERGLGLGLSICSTIVTSHGGRLSLANSQGGGATAVVSLPAPAPLAAAS
jgi:C4-dicarboxylate-specific signal transduction histidine kinase